MMLMQFLIKLDSWVPYKRPWKIFGHSGPRSFTGRGRLLTGESVPNAPQQPESVVHNIVFWRNGFTVNDGPLRRLDDPENAPFLESIRKSECPKELEPADRRSSVHVNLIRREEHCPSFEYAQRFNRQCFADTFIGSLVSHFHSSSLSTVVKQLLKAAWSRDDRCCSHNSAPSPSSLVVDTSLPSTTIQLRLADGTRMIAHFKPPQYIADIRSFIDASRRGRSTSYQLRTVGFPPKVLTDLTHN
ncbi:UNVERIFIED_CONTAM: Plant UBX domain-containing protein 4 [Sesamum angustifolium]|uniref:Plant UBX domain-containing protein 4 n=1 Tax=Sesamum angustifolium TaxID=2727405 RepID=A0AAW2PB37_9LAMI